MYTSSGYLGTFRVGTSGYQYDHWRGVLYPDDEPKRRWFELYSREFDSVEINNTFYNLPQASTFNDWADEAPDDFLFVLKYSRYGTHMKRLKDPGSHVDHFIRRARRLGDKLGPILVQLPPNFKADASRLDQFLKAVPDDCRWSLEFRNSDWLRDEVYDVLGRHNAGLCIHDMIEDHPYVITADWIYLRFHAAQHNGNYPYQALSAAARRIKRHLADGLDVFAYFNNDAGGHAIHNARDLRRYVTDYEVL
jgi:uncharacterized protein YecE (DUF72 family)